jgi:phosphatidylglycerophosphate synthase
MLANWITLSRYPLLLVFIAMIYSQRASVVLASVPLLLFAILLDSLDGYIARSRNKTSMMGSVLDIALDRTYELVMWVILLDFRMIPAAIPLIVIVRTVLTDALRSLGVSKGELPFDQQKGKLGAFIVKSPWMRTGYSVSKIAAFCGLTLAYAFTLQNPGTWAQVNAVVLAEGFRAVAWMAALLCVIRGLPVIAAYADSLFNGNDTDGDVNEGQ